jgi:peptidoglycan/xylan/chitin deacetylase (PgdA/CDA1 family)
VAQLGAAPRRADAVDLLHEAAHDRTVEEAGLTPAPAGAALKLELCAGSEINVDSDSDAMTPAAPVVGGAPKPKNPNAIVRLAWTFDDGPTAVTPAMERVMGSVPGTWFIMRNQLGKGAARAAALKRLAEKQKKGAEFGIHAFHPDIDHHSWYPVGTGIFPKAYDSVSAAMADLTEFVGMLRGAGIKPKFVRFPGGEFTETRAYLESLGTSAAASGALTYKILQGKSVAGHGAAAAKVKADYEAILATLSELGLVLWGGTSSGPLLLNDSWEAEASPEGGKLANNAVSQFKKVVNVVVDEGKPHSLVILAHDTFAANPPAVKKYVAEMDNYARSKDVKIEYYTMMGLYLALRGTAP